MKIGIYGLGRFGSFWATQLAAHGHQVLGYSRHSRPVLPQVTLASEQEVLSCPYVFYCVSISAFESVLKQTSSLIAPGTVVMDTCSVKVYPSRWMKTELSDGIHCIATHPMFGPDSGKNGIAGLPFVICNMDCNVEEYKAVYDAMADMKLKMLEMTPDAHDREAAWSQGITHFIGRVLDELDLQPTELATTGYKRLLSIVEQTCNDPLQLFYDLQHYNPYTKQMRMGLKGALDYVLAELVSKEQ